MGRAKLKAQMKNSNQPKLDSSDRVGRKARNTVWSHTISFLRRNWKPLFGLFTTLFLSLLLPSFFLRGATRWLFIGAVGATSFWLVVLAVTIWSGIAPLIMGIQGESSTADVLSDFKSRDWRLIHGMHFPGSGDIDHVLLGPSGILVIETKWSREKWPMKNEKRPYITNQLNGAIAQVIKNREILRTKLESVTEDVPIYCVCVLWSAMDSSKEIPYFYRKGPDFVYGVRGPELADWLLALRKNALDPARVQRIATEMEQMVRDLDDKSGESYRLPLSRIVNDSIWLPALGFLTPTLGFAAASLLKNGYVNLGSLAVLGALGLYIRQRSRFKAVIVCWFASLGLLAGYLVGLEIRFLLR